MYTISQNIFSKFQIDVKLKERSFIY